MKHIPYHRYRYARELRLSVEVQRQMARQEHRLTRVSDIVEVHIGPLIAPDRNFNEHPIGAADKAKLN